MTENDNKQPLGIKIIAVLLILLGLNSIGMSFVFEELSSSEFLEESQRELYNIIFSFVVGISFAVVLFIAAAGLFFKKKYAKKMTEIISVLMIISGALNLLSEISGLLPLIGGIIVILYFRQKTTKRYFWSIDDYKR